MLKEELIKRAIKRFKVQECTLPEVQDKDVILMVHLTSAYEIDSDYAKDNCSTGSHDHGIDGWFYDNKTKTLKLLACSYCPTWCTPNAANLDTDAKRQRFS